MSIISPDSVKAIGHSSGNLGKSPHFVLVDPKASSRLLIAIMLGQFASSFFWTHLAQSISAPRTLALANLSISMMVAAFVFAHAPRGQVIAFCVGTALAGGLSIPWTRLSNGVEDSEAISGSRHESQAFALFLAALKLGSALSFLMIGRTLSGLGVRGTDTVSAQRELTTTVCWLAISPPGLGSLLCAWISLNLSNTCSGHARQLAARTQSTQTKTTMTGED